MASIAGSAEAFNPLNGIVSVTTMTDAEFESNKEEILDCNIWIYNKDTKKIYFTDGVSALKNLNPRVDQTLTSAEKTALEKAFPNNGEYSPAAGGVVVHAEDGKIDDVSFKFIDKAGKRITNEYLSFMLDGNDKVKLENLPDIVRADWNFFADIEARDATDDEHKRGFALVIDATGDPTVKSGWAMYVWTTLSGDGGQQWLKVAEGESLDIPADMLVNYVNVQHVGAVMYDHPLLIKSQNLGTIVSLLRTSAVPTITANDVSGTQAAEVATGISFAGKRTTDFTVKVTCTGCTMNNFDSATVEADTPVEKTGTISEINDLFSNAKIVVGASAGTVKVEWLGQSKTINVTVTPAA